MLKQQVYIFSKKYVSGRHSPCIVAKVLGGGHSLYFIFCIYMRDNFLYLSCYNPVKDNNSLAVAIADPLTSQPTGLYGITH